VLPGVGPALTVAMLMPLTIKLDATGALIMFAGIYYGAMYGGSTTTILLNTPGESASIATALEGNLMAKNGRAGPALATCAIGSFVAGTIATILVTLLAPMVVEIALQFGPAEYFALMVFAFTTVSAVIGSSTARGLTSLFLGLLFGVIGIDSQTGRSRFAFGVPELLDGIDVVVLAVGLFAVGEALYVAAYASRIEENKGFHVLAAALKALETQGGRIAEGRWRWVIVGEGPYRSRLAHLVASAGLGPRVVFAGRTSDRDLHAWYEAADLFVHPTLYEGSSLVTLEAMAHRRAVVATTAGGLPDKVQHGVSGWLVAPGDASALAAAVSGALGDTQRLRAMGLEGRAIVEREFSWDATGAATVRLYEELL